MINEYEKLLSYIEGFIAAYGWKHQRDYDAACHIMEKIREFREKILIQNKLTAQIESMQVQEEINKFK